MTERSRSEMNAASDESTPDENSPSVDTLFDLLSNARRRGVLYALKRDGAASVDELARRVASWQAGEPSPEHVRTSLIHSHLPRLDDANVVDYDSESHTVELADADDLEPLLRATGESKPSPSGGDHYSSPAD